MITRLVKMTFREDEVESFLENFNTNKASIRSFKGCLHLELWQDIHMDNVFWTFSKWDSEIYLNNYRNSELFKRVWSKTKAMFKEKPCAWSVKAIEEIHSNP